MKKLLLITLKILELAALVGVYFGLCKVGYWIIILMDGESYLMWHNPYCMLLGFISLFGVFLTIFLIYSIITLLIPWWINLNKKWVNKIYGNLHNKHPR